MRKLHPTDRAISRQLALIVALFVLACLLPVLSRALSEQDPSPTDHVQQKVTSVPGEIIVRFRDDSKISKASRSTETVIKDGRQFQIQLERLGAAEIVGGLRLARVNPADTMAAMEALRSRPDVLYAEPNFIRQKAAVPNDPRYPEMWNLKNTGQSGGTVGADIDAELAWNTTTGNRNIVVGVVDQGIDINHPDLSTNIWRNPGEIAGNSIDDDANGFVDDLVGWDFFNNDNTVFDGNGTFPADQTDAHGTHVAGTIGATGNNGVGVVGVNWETSLMSLKFLGATGGSTANLLSAFSYAKMMRDLWISSGGTRGANLRVLNNSYGGLGFSQAELDAIRVLNTAGILFVAAAGNDGVNNDLIPHYPASYDSPNIISVHASNRFDQGHFTSNYGRSSVAMSAPGAQILSTTPGSTYTVNSGTSMAAPHVAGAAALILGTNPTLSLSTLRHELMFNGDFVGQTTTSGRRLNVANVFQAIAENDATPPSAPSNFRITGQTGRFVTLGWTATGDDGLTGRASLYEIRFADTDLTDPAVFEQSRVLITQTVGNFGQPESTSIQIPVRHPSGFVGIRALDNIGNKSAIATLPVSAALEFSDPYLISQSAPTQLSTGGTPLNLKGDDIYTGYGLPFEFKFFGFSVNGVTVSTNGGLFFSIPVDQIGIPRFPNGQSADIPSLRALDRLTMIAGIWDDLRTDRRVGDDVYVVIPDHSRVIFRWQAVTFADSVSGIPRGENPVAFEIELGRDGSIQVRYGDGNQNLYPVVGLSGGPDSYPILSHTSELASKNLTNAPTVSFTLRNPPPPPSSDMQIVSLSDSPDPVFSGQFITYNIEMMNTFETFDVVLTDTLPPNTSFVRCTSTFTSVACSASGQTVTARMDQMNSFTRIPIAITAQVNAPPGTTLTNSVSVGSLWNDPNPNNNSSSVTTQVIEPIFFDGVTKIVTRGSESGGAQTLAIRNDGTLWSWGQFGDGVISPGKVTPVQVSGMTNVAGVSPGGSHILAWKTDGSLWAWGSNLWGVLGAGTTGNINVISRVINLSNVQSAAAGENHSVAVLSDGTVWTWGSDQHGQLGRGVFNPVLSQHTPIQAINLSGIVAVAAGSWHTLALKDDGTVWAWGFNADGQSGINPSTRDTPTPAQVPGLSNVIAIAAGTTHSIALRSDGTVWGWGSGRSGQFGNGVLANSTVPVPVGNYAGVTAIGAGSFHTLVLKSDRTVWASGINSSGQLGDGTNSGKTTPVRVSGLSGVTAISAGSESNAALLADTTVRMWGNNTSGQLGDSTTQNRNTPVPVSGLLSVSSPTVTPFGGQFNTPVVVFVNCVTPGVVIHYTLTGGTPTEADPVIASGSSLIIEVSTDLRLRAFKANAMPSSISGANFTILPPANSIDSARFFVVQHYQDFLNRLPDDAGQDYWTAQITSCGTDLACIHSRRIGVSAAFFVEAEFQRTGYVVYRMHRAAFGTLPGGPTRANLTFARFMADRPLVIDGVPQSTIDFANAFVQRPEFLQAYPTSDDNTAFVNKLFDTAGLIPYTTERQQQITAMNNNGKTRAQVLLDVIEINEFKTREYDRAFVLMQYFGYLRRDADQGGYDFWLNVLRDRVPNNYRAMVCAFLTSAEYQQRFGTVVTRTNQDCAQ